MLMKKLLVLAVVLTMVAGVQAKEKGKAKPAVAVSTTKSEFITAEEKKAEVSGAAFDKAAAEALFASKDKNGDGVLTADEAKAAKHKGKKK
jgi:hypothetical protein